MSAASRVTVSSRLDLSALPFIVILLTVLIVSLSVHEAAHAWTSNKLGDPTARMLGRLTLNPLSHIDWIGTVLFPLIAIFSGFPLLGWAKPVPVDMRMLRHPRRDFAIVAAAGPISNLLLATAGAVVIHLMIGAGLVGDRALPLAYSILLQFVSLNVLLAIFNLLPVPPLDGGNVLAGLVPESIARVIDAMRPWGFLILYALLFSGVLGTIVRPVSDAVRGLLL